MNIFAKFKRNDTAVNDGKMLVLGKDDNGNDVGVIVARIHASNVAFKTFLENEKKKNQHALEHMSDDEQSKFVERITDEAIKATCIKGFIGLTDDKGTVIDTSPETIERVHKELPELFDQIVRFGLDSKNYVGSFDEEASLKN